MELVPEEFSHCAGDPLVLCGKGVCVMQEHLFYLKEGSIERLKDVDCRD